MELTVENVLEAYKEERLIPTAGVFFLRGEEADMACGLSALAVHNGADKDVMSIKRFMGVESFTTTTEWFDDPVIAQRVGFIQGFDNTYAYRDLIKQILRGEEPEGQVAEDFREADRIGLEAFVEGWEIGRESHRRTMKYRQELEVEIQSKNLAMV